MEESWSQTLNTGLRVARASTQHLCPTCGVGQWLGLTLCRSHRLILPATGVRLHQFCPPASGLR